MIEHQRLHHGKNSWLLSSLMSTCPLNLPSSYSLLDLANLEYGTGVIDDNLCITVLCKQDKTVPNINSLGDFVIREQRFEYTSIT